MSTLRCQPGDMAVTIGRDPQRPEHSGLLCEVLYLAPRCEFRTPDCQLQLPSRGRQDGLPCWVVQFSAAVTMPVLHSDGTMGTRQALYGVCPDCCLQPIRGIDAPASIQTAEPVREAAA